MTRFIATALLVCATVQAAERTPVLVELFTSEGCSSCPPADKLLAEFERKQPVANADLIVLSEHVDYWDNGGWRDPFSASLFTDRQKTYAELLHTDDVYTPQVVVDGQYATVGSRGRDILKAISEVAQTAKPELQLNVTRQGNTVLVDVPANTPGNVWVALTEASVVSHVAHGENGGLTLQHVGVVRSLKKLPASNQGQINLNKDWSADLRVVAFVQDKHSGRILQAVQKKL